MNEAYLGISFGFHDSAAALVGRDGHVLFASSEERYTRIKGDASWPENSIHHALQEAQINNLRIIGLCGHENYQDSALWMLNTRLNPFHRNNISKSQFAASIRRYLDFNLKIDQLLADLSLSRDSFFLSDHHKSHVLASYAYSNYRSGLFFIFDAVGQAKSGLIGYAQANKKNPIVVLKSLKLYQSIGLFYSSITQICGFKVLTGEYKLMGLAPYGSPVYFDRLCQVFGKPCLSSFNTTILNPFADKLANSNLESALGMPIRIEESELTHEYKNLAASAQKYLEVLVISIINSFISQDISIDDRNLILGGGVALNCKLTKEIQTSFPDFNVSICPAAGDAGSAIGACFARLLETDSISTKQVNHAYLGDSYSSDSLTIKLEALGFKYHVISKSTTESICNDLMRGNIGAIFKGRAEFGPRALGNRSILANPGNPSAIQKINTYIKSREDFRPLAPITTPALARQFFDADPTVDPLLFFMLTLIDVPLETQRLIPSAVHVDGTARLQILDNHSNEFVFDLISQFFELTGIPALINTSFNQRGEPIVQSLQDALTCFSSANLDFLVMEDCLLIRADQDQMLLDSYRRKNSLELD